MGSNMGGSMDWDTDMSIWRGFSGYSIGEWCRGPRECSSSGQFDLDSLGICTITNSFGVVEYARNTKQGHSTSMSDEASPSSPPSSPPLSPSVENGSVSVGRDFGEQGDMLTPSSGIMFIFQQCYPDISLEDQQDGCIGCVMDGGISAEVSNVNGSLGTRQTGVMSAYEINVLSGLAEEQHDEYNVYPRNGCLRVDRSRVLDDCLTAPAA